MEPIVKLSLGDSSTCHLRQSLREALVKQPEVCVLLFVFFFPFTNNEVLSKTEVLLGFFGVKRVNSLVSLATQYSTFMHTTLAVVNCRFLNPVKTIHKLNDWFYQ